MIVARRRPPAGPGSNPSTSWMVFSRVAPARASWESLANPYLRLKSHPLRSGPLIAKALLPVLRFGPRFGPQTHSGALAAFRPTPVGGDIARKALGPSAGRNRDWQQLVAYRTGRPDPSFLLQSDGKTHMTDIIPTAAEAKTWRTIAAKLLQNCCHARRQLRDAQSPNGFLQRCRRR